jgi:hypothetical protein
MKARGAKRIRYPCSPSSKHCTLNISTSSGGISAEGKPRVCYLGSIVARLKLKGIGGETLQQVTRAVQLDSTPWTSPGPTAGWRSVWRAYLTRWEELHGRRQPVPWGDQLNLVTGKTHIHIYNELYVDCLGNKDESVGYVRWVQPECPGQHARVNGEYNGMRLWKEKLIP